MCFVGHYLWQQKAKGKIYQRFLWTPISFSWSWNTAFTWHKVHCLAGVVGSPLYQALLAAQSRSLRVKVQLVSVCTSSKCISTWDWHYQNYTQLAKAYLVFLFTRQKACNIPRWTDNVARVFRDLISTTILWSHCVCLSVYLSLDW